MKRNLQETNTTWPRRNALSVAPQDGIPPETPRQAVLERRGSRHPEQTCSLLQ